MIKEKRRCERKNFISRISVLLSPGDMLEDHRITEHALAMDICDEGLSLYIDSPVRKRQVVNVRGSYNSNIHKQAVVRWVRKADKGLYKAGLMFVK